jgi:hypothetical protein
VLGWMTCRQADSSRGTYLITQLPHYRLHSRLDLLPSLNDVVYTETVQYALRRPVLNSTNEHAGQLALDAYSDLL